MEPLDVMVTLPLAEPATVGLNNTVNEVLWPAFNVRGNDNPLRLNPVPLTEAAEIVRLEPPELVRDPLKGCEVPTCTFPKLKLLGFAVSEPAARPVPEREIPSGELDASDEMLNVPVADPAAVGLKLTVNEAL